MEVFKSKSLRLRFVLLLGLLTVLVIAQNGALLWSNMTVVAQSEKIAKVEIPILNKAHELKLSVVQVQQWLTDISATRGRDGLDDGFAEAQNNARRFKQLIGELKTLDSDHAPRYEAMIPVFDAYYETGRRMARAYIDEGPAAGNKMMAQFDGVAEKISAEVDSFQADVRVRVADMTTQQRTSTLRGRYFLAISSLLVLGGIVLVYVILARALGYLPLAVAELQRVADGDLTSNIEVTRKDEIGDLMRALQGMRRHLLDMVSQISGTTFQLSAAAEGMTSLTQQTNSSIQQQRAETERVASVMADMTATVQGVAGNIVLTTNAADEANAETVAGKRVVEQAMEEIGRLAEQIEGAAGTISQLEQDSEAISTVLDVIRGWPIRPTCWP